MATWTIDPAHSEVQFKVKHLVVSTVTGYFKSFEGTLEGNPEDLENATLTFSADIDSIETGSSQRDGHLKSGDFFDAANHPKLTFKSTSIKSKGNNEYAVEGVLSLRGVEKTITLEVSYGGTAKGFAGEAIYGFEIIGKINRKDYGLTWDATTESGNIVVSNEVRIIINAEVKEEVAA